MTTRHELFLALLVIAGLVPSAAAFAVAWLRTSRRLRELETRVFGPSLPREPYADRLEQTERLEHAVGQMAAQLEQVITGQEFLHRVLAERLSPPKAELTRRDSPS